MKKKMILAGMALLAMTACSKDKAVQVNPGETIAFRTSVPNATRATATTTQSLAKFHVWAYSDNALVFHQDVTKTGAAWNTSENWAGRTWDFYAFAPETVAASVTLTNTDKKYENFTPADAAENQIDLIAAQATGRTEANSASGVALTFKHLLSQIEIKAKSSKTENMKVEVLGVRVNSVKSTSTFTFPADLNSGVKTGWWAAPTTEKSFFIKGTAPVTLTDQAQSLMFDKGNFMLIPYQLVAWDLASDKTNTKKGSYLSILCRVSQKAADGTWKQVYPATEGKYNFSAVPINTNWEPGKKYVYTLNMFGPKGNGGGNQDPNPTVDPTPDPDVDPTPGVDPGNPILGGTISFTVDVEDWDVVNVEDIDM